MANDLESNYTELHGKIIAETEKALLFSIDDKEHWFPKSTLLRIIRTDITEVVSIEDELSGTLSEDELAIAGHSDIIFAANWLVEKKGLD